MNELAKKQSITQQDICRMQDYIQDVIAQDPTAEVELKYTHYFADGIYGRVMHCPAGSWVIGKPHRTQHLCVLLKGRLAVTADDGSIKELSAPSVFVAEAGAKKAAYVIEDLEFMNIHPNADNGEDLDAIESRLIFPEQEFRQYLQISQQATEQILQIQEKQQ